MLTINLEQIVSEINNRRNRVRYQFQELALMLTEKLSDTRHKSLYMKIAKNEEQELIMDALHYVTAGNLSGNLGAIFMWKLKELKSRPLLPVALRYECEGGYFKAGQIDGAVRGDMPLLVAAFTEYATNFPDELTIKEKVTVEQREMTIEQLPFTQLPATIDSLMRDFKRKVRITVFRKWLWISPTESSIPELPITGILKVGAPTLTKRAVSRKMQPS